MMRKIFYIKIIIGIQVLLLLSCGSLFGQKYNPNIAYQTTLSLNKLKGNVKKIITKYYHRVEQDSLLNVWRKFVIDSVGTATFLTMSIEQEFDINGIKQTQTNSSFYFANKSLDWFLDDEKMQNTSTTIPTLSFKLNDTTSIKYKFFKSTHQYFYDSLNRLIQVKQLTKNTNDGHGADFIYDVKGNLISSKFWGNNNSLSDAYDNKYDKNDSLVEIEHYDYKIPEFSIEKCKYFPSQKKYLYNLYLVNGRNLYCTKTYQTDKNGVAIFEETHTHRCNFRKSYTKSKTNKDGVLESYVFYNRDGKLVSSFNTTYYKIDINGMVLEFEYKNEITGTILKYYNEYKYDNLGNIIEQKSYDENKKLKSVAYTTYQYY